MPTTVSHTIGTASRDYSTFQAWHDASPASLVTADDIWLGLIYNDAEFTGNSTFLSVSHATDATRYFKLQPATGQGYRDNGSAATLPLRYDASKGVGIRWTSGYGSMIGGGSGFDLDIDGVQFSYGSGTASNYSPPIEGMRALHNCLFESIATSANQINYVKELVNCVIVMRGATFSGTAVRPSSNSPGVDHYIGLTIVRPSDLTAGGTAISGGGDGYPVVSDCAVFGFTTAFAGTIASYGSGSGNNASDAASANVPGSSNQAGLTYTSQFQVTTDSTRDWRPKSAGALNTNGTRQQTYTGDVDIVSVARSTTTPSIGAREFVAGGGPTTTTKVMEDDLAVIDGFVKLVVIRNLKVLGDNLVITDGDIFFKRNKRVAEDDLTLTDGFVKILVGSGVTHTKLLTDTLTVDDTDTLRVYAIIADDFLTIADEQFRIAKHYRILGDTLDVTDASLPYAKRKRLQSDTLSIADGNVSIRRSLRVLEDDLTIPDSVIKILPTGGAVYKLTQSDALNLLDDAGQRYAFHVRSISDSLTVPDQAISLFLHQGVWLAVMGDNLTVIEELLRNLSSIVTYDARMRLGSDHNHIRLGGY